MKNNIEFKIPAWLVPIICNDDWTATNDAEEKAAKEFFAKTCFDWGSGHWVVNEETGFGKNDVDIFAGDTYAATYVADGFFDQINRDGIQKMISDRFPDITENDMSGHRSDFYVIFTPAVWHWLRRIHPNPGNISKFTGTDGRMWIDVPFALLYKYVENA